jgi:hypothetical protein
MPPTNIVEPLLALLGDEVRARGVSLREVCRQVGWPVDSLSQILNQERSFLVEHFLGLAAWLEISPEELLASCEVRRREEDSGDGGHEGAGAGDTAAESLGAALDDLRRLLRHSVKRNGLPSLLNDPPLPTRSPTRSAAAVAKAQEPLCRALLEHLIHAAGSTPTRLSVEMGRSRTYLLNVVLCRDGRRSPLRMSTLLETLAAINWKPVGFFATLRRELGAQPRWQAPRLRLGEPTPDQLLEAVFDVIAEETGRRPRWGEEKSV